MSMTELQRSTMSYMCGDGHDDPEDVPESQPHCSPNYPQSLLATVDDCDDISYLDTNEFYL